MAVRRYISLSFLLLISTIAGAQHCPWDCAGLLLLKTDASTREMGKLNPVLVDGNKNIVVDTVYGTGKETYDTCAFLYYDEFIKYRTERIKLHSWYGYDTLLHFADKHYVVHYNFCKFKWDQSGKLFIRYSDPESTAIAYRYIEVPVTSGIHLHDYNKEIRERKTGDILTAIQSFILFIPRNRWGLK